ncbi:hypothetical protein GQF61_07540 [Sphingobacterium sp. DK4209]|uniref:Uncharacterized protein n=1 Tax=Sphingobacterium zhuxiongii TaxID=2662364 RepID=A0A5Q0QDK3_9SPHI|nr:MULTISPECIES: PKD-like family lipoprotein [unclassified Sphingobacterium]MVZ65707.1 hypothetical protein [Sphingobacterium sp. DK4209]QGA27905.1 hypothetical protein GFH32_16930 [Sphingobacterium sp. dk4302]
MKQKAFCILSSLFILLLIICSCAKDHGNYQYQEINRLEIQNDKGGNFEGSRIIVDKNENINIAPKIAGTLQQVNDKDLNFWWILEQDTISTDKQLRINSGSLLPGKYVGKFIVLDKQTGLTYSFTFEVLVLASVGTGSYVLTENELNQTKLFMFSRDSSKAPVSISGFDKGSFGTKPVNLEVSYNVQTDSSFDYKRLLIVTEQGEYPMIALDFNTLGTSFVIPSSGTIPNDKLLKPTYYQSDHFSSLNVDKFDGIVLIGGKCYNFKDGLFSGDSYWQDPLDYNFGEKDVIYTGSSQLKGYFISGYDSKNGLIRVFDNGLTGGGLYWNNSDDKQYFPYLTEGKTSMAIATIDDHQPTWFYLLKEGNLVGLLETTSRGLSPERLEVIYFNESEILANGKGFILKDDYWYFALERTIYRFPKRELIFQPYLTLPEDETGDIVSFKFAVNNKSEGNKIGIATYKDNAVQQKKGSFYLYDFDSKSLERKSLFEMDRAVDMRICY